MHTYSTFVYTTGSTVVYGVLYPIYAYSSTEGTVYMHMVHVLLYVQLEYWSNTVSSIWYMALIK